MTSRLVSIQSGSGNRFETITFDHKHAPLRLHEAAAQAMFPTSPGSHVMLQIFDAVTQTVIRLAEQHGWKVALAVLAVVACGVVLRLLARVLMAGRPKES